MRFATLIELLEYRQSATGTAVALTFQDDPFTFHELWAGINQFAHQLRLAGLERGEPVVILLPNGKEFFLAFYGVQRAGGIAVPLFPGSSAERVVALAQACEARRAVIEPGREQELAGAAQAGVQLIRIGSTASGSYRNVFPTIRPEDVAFLQYTSGSTGEPKAVMLSHENLLTNVCQMIAGMEITSQDVFVSWLPAYHDMGLILMTMAPFYLAANLHLLPASLQNVRSWLEKIAAVKGTFTAAPDFAYRLAIRSVAAEVNYDLSSLRVALNAAEPVRAQTISAFEETFGLKHVMTAGYGLAEATVGVSMSAPGSAPRVDAHGLVSVGKPFPEIELQIVSDGKALPPGAVGEIAIRSPANSRGYYHDPEATQALFWQENFVLSGDLGYLDSDGFLTIVGRKKNVIKHAGETIAPSEIEALVEAIPDVRTAAAVGIDRSRLEGEQVFIFAEVRGNLAAEKAEELTMQIVNDFHNRLGFRPGRVYWLKARAIPRTHNGKIQHALLKQQYQRGELRSQGLILYPDY